MAKTGLVRLAPPAGAAEDDDAAGAAAAPAPVGSVRSRSPRIITSAWMTVLPPRMIFVVPMRCDLRETLLPVS